MPRILVTRKLPASVLAALESAGTVDVHADEAALSADQLRQRLRDADAVVAMLNDQFDAAIALSSGSRIVWCNRHGFAEPLSAQ